MPPANASRLAVEQAIAALRAGDPVDAERTLRQRLAVQPADIEVMAKLGDILAEQNRMMEASVLYKRALSLAPLAHQIRIALAHMLNKQGQFMAALSELEAAEGPVRSTGVRALEGDLLGKLGMHDRELALYQSMTADFPDNPVLWMCMGNTLKTVGRMEEAVAAFRQAIKLQPTYGEAYWSLANLKTFRFEPRDVTAMRKALRGKLDPGDALHFHFALGKALENHDDTTKSFRHYAAGNAIRAGQLNTSSAGITLRVDAAIAFFGSDFLGPRSGWGCMAPDPIYRRQSAALRLDLDRADPRQSSDDRRHCRTDGARTDFGERLGRIEGKGRDPWSALAALGQKEIEALGAEYLERTRAFRLSDRPMFVDKLPANWMNVGLIKLILPKAKIIDARRHPMACGFSNLRQNYAFGRHLLLQPAIDRSFLSGLLAPDEPFRRRASGRRAPCHQ